MPTPEERIAVLMAVDEQYAAPLFVTISSLVEHLHSQMGLDLYLMAPELSPKTWDVLQSTWGERVHLHRVLVNPARFASSLVGPAFFPLSHCSLSSHGRGLSTTPSFEGSLSRRGPPHPTRPV